MDTQAARTTLEQMLRDHCSARTTLDDDGAGQSCELTHVTQHPGDVGTDVADADRELALLENTADQRAQVQAALARLDAGTYGTCVDCGQPIDEARLEFRPEAARCLVDQQKHEAAGG